MAAQASGAPASSLVGCPAHHPRRCLRWRAGCHGGFGRLLGSAAFDDGAVAASEVDTWLGATGSPPRQPLLPTIQLGQRHRMWRPRASWCWHPERTSPATVTCQPSRWVLTYVPEDSLVEIATVWKRSRGSRHSTAFRSIVSRAATRRTAIVVANSICGGARAGPWDQTSLLGTRALGHVAPITRTGRGWDYPSPATLDRLATSAGLVSCAGEQCGQHGHAVGECLVRQWACGDE